MNTQNSPLAEMCAAAAVRLVARHHIGVLSPSTFADLTLAAMRSGSFASADSAALRVYALALYSACAAPYQLPTDRERDPLHDKVAHAVRRHHRSVDAAQAQAYTELYTYLYDIAHYRYPELSEDIAQTALEHVFTKLATCRVPGAFLKFAVLQLVTAARQQLRQEAQTVRSLDVPLTHGEGLTLGHVLADEHAERAFEHVDAASIRGQVARCLAVCLHRHPRARVQIAAVWLKYIEGLDDGAIGRRLGKSSASIYTARSRGLRLLAAEPEFQQLAAELDLWQLPPAETPAMQAPLDLRSRAVGDLW